MARSAFMTDARGLHVVQDPADVLDYQLNWANWLGGDTIVTSAFTVSDGLTKNSEARTSSAATVVISGGAAGQTYTVTNHITTAGGRTVERSFLVDIRDR